MPFNLYVGLFELLTNDKNWIHLAGAVGGESHTTSLPMFLKTNEELRIECRGRPLCLPFPLLFAQHRFFTGLRIQRLFYHQLSFRIGCPNGEVKRKLFLHPHCFLR